MTAKKLNVGASLESWCTKCKEDRDHVVESLKSDGTVGKVRCGFCDGSHLYRRPKGAKDEKGAPATTRRRATRAESSFTEAETAKAKPYAMDRDFGNGDILNHPKFGVGRVTAVRSGGKMEVAFADGVRLLVCRDTGSTLLRRAPRAAVKVAVAVVAVVEEAADDDDVATDDEAADTDETAAGEDDSEE